MKIKVTNYRKNTENILTITNERQKEYVRDLVEKGECRSDCFGGYCPLCRTNFNNRHSYCINYSYGLQGKIEILDDTDDNDLCEEEREILEYLYFIEQGVY